MALGETGKHRAALLLMSLDESNAAKLLEGLSPEQIKALSVEMARIYARGKREQKNKTQVINEFHKLLEKGQNKGLNIITFFNETLCNILDDEAVKDIQTQVKSIVEKQNPFEPINAATVDELALALQNESPQTIAVVLSQLQPRKASELLPILEKELCINAVWNMAVPPRLNRKTKERMAAVICQRLKEFRGETAVKQDKQTLRNVAIMLSDTERNLRNETIDLLKERDEETGTMIKKLMVTWRDIPTIADRSLQEALRAVDTSKLAIALYQAEEDVVQKIRSNISERVAEALDEELSLMQEPLEEEVLEGREEIVKPLRDANEEGTLRRVRG